MKRELISCGVLRNNNKNKKKCCKTEEEIISIRRGPWTLEEDTSLIHHVGIHGEGRWNFIAKASGLKRTGKSCRLRWLNYLKPDIKRGNLTPQEQLLILELHSKWGNRWSRIAAHLPGRTDNEIKNYWRTRVQKQARQLNMESNSQSFIDAIRCFYMPRLVQKIEQSSTTTSTSATLNAEASPPPSDITQTDDQTTKETSIPCSNTPENVPHHQTSPSSSAYSSGKTVITVSSLVPEEDFYNVDSSIYDMDLSSMSAILDFHVPGPEWLTDHDVAEEDAIWDFDELWQFKK